MTRSARRADFFILEATEYLGDLEPVAAQPGIPDMERLIRGSRGLRGAALMAGLGTFARAAAGLEAIARAVRDHAIGWEPAARDAWRDGVQNLRLLVSRAVRWESDDDRQALAMADRFEQVLGSQVPGPSGGGLSAVQAPAASGLMTPGVRAFIARESALIAGSLHDAARALAPQAPIDALSSVLERMRSLRGLGASGELSPLPELLDAMEVTTRSMLTVGPVPADVAGLFDDAADALVSMAKSVSESGRITLPAGLDGLARRLLDTYAGEHDVVAMASLAPDDSVSVLKVGALPPEPDTEPVPVELVGVGDHLLVQADALERAGSTIARDLRLFTLHRTLATMPRRSGSARFLAPLVNSINQAIANGSAAEQPLKFAAMLRDAGHFLVDGASAGDLELLAQERDQMADHWRGSPSAISSGPRSLTAGEADGATKVVAIASAALASDDDVVDIESLTMDDEVTVDIVSLAPTDVDVIVDIASLAPTDDDVIVDIASLAPTDDDVIVDIASLAPTGDDVIVDIASLAPDAMSTDETDVVAIDSLASEPNVPATAPGQPGRLERAMRDLARIDSAPVAARKVTVTAPEDATAIVAMVELIYRGESAVGRMSEVRTELLDALEVPAAALPDVRHLIEELLDLVSLANDVT